MSFIPIFRPPLDKATGIFVVKLKGGCDLYVPVNQPSHISDEKIKESLQVYYEYYVDTTIN